MCMCRKLVSVLLLALVPTASSLAVAACPQGMANMGNPHAEMAMMGMPPVQLSLSVTPSNLCCQVSPAEIVLDSVRAAVGGDISATLIPSALGAGTLSSPKANT